MKVPRLRNYDLYEKEGIAGLYDKQPFMLAWTYYQSYLVKKLNELTAGKSNLHISTRALHVRVSDCIWSRTGTGDENLLARDIAVKYARWADKSALFNHASAAQNNHIFFASIVRNA